MANTNPKEINHIGVSISGPDIEEAIDWYKKIFGFKVIAGPVTIPAPCFRGIIGP
jgi:catechol 2,3-dioxygenase-like lactoylglutathione lyase family enzyme